MFFLHLVSLNSGASVFGFEYCTQRRYFIPSQGLNTKDNISCATQGRKWKKIIKIIWHKNFTFFCIEFITRRNVFILGTPKFVHTDLEVHQWTFGHRGVGIVFNYILTSVGVRNQMVNLRHLVWTEKLSSYKKHCNLTTLIINMLPCKWIVFQVQFFNLSLRRCKRIVARKFGLGR